MLTGARRSISDVYKTKLTLKIKFSIFDRKKFFNW